MKFKLKDIKWSVSTVLLCVGLAPFVWFGSLVFAGIVLMLSLVCSGTTFHQLNQVENIFGLESLLTAILTAILAIILVLVSLSCFSAIPVLSALGCYGMAVLIYRLLMRAQKKYIIMASMEKPLIILLSAMLTPTIYNLVWIFLSFSNSMEESTFYAFCFTTVFIFIGLVSAVVNHKRKKIV